MYSNSFSEQAEVIRDLRAALCDMTQRRDAAVASLQLLAASCKESADAAESILRYCKAVEEDNEALREQLRLITG